MTHHGAEERIRCPSCGANNFPGVSHCWQCGVPLPPGLGHGTFSHVQPARSPRRLPLIIPVLALLALAVMGVLILRSTLRARVAGGPLSAQEMRDLEQRLLRRSELESRPAPSGPDALEAQARRELERLKRQAGILEERQGGAVRPPAGPGMRISPEEWERAGRDLRGIQ